LNFSVEGVVPLSEIGRSVKNSFWQQNMENIIEDSNNGQLTPELKTLSQPGYIDLIRSMQNIGSHETML